MTLQQFIDALYDIGWDSPCDAQHNKIAVLWDELREKGITTPFDRTPNPEPEENE